jgi:hypothetical protein
MFRRIFVLAHLFSCAGRSLAFASSRLRDMAMNQNPPKRQATSSCAIMHGLGVYHLPGSKQEVITSGAPATECLHARVAPDAFVVRVSPPGPDSCQMVLAFICRAAFRTAFPRVSSSVEIRCSSSTRNRWGACMHGCGTCSSFTGKPPSGPFRSIPDSLRSPRGFEMRVARSHHRFSTVPQGSWLIYC